MNSARYYYRQYYTRHMKVCEELQSIKAVFVLRSAVMCIEMNVLSPPQFNPILVLVVGLCAWSAFDYTSRMLSYKQAVKYFKESPEYKQNLRRLKEEKMMELEREGVIKRKINGRRWGPQTYD
jgi:hypothetical protein